MNELTREQQEIAKIIERYWEWISLIDCIRYIKSINRFWMISDIRTAYYYVYQD
jgi:hypothetical protein